MSITKNLALTLTDYIIINPVIVLYYLSHINEDDRELKEYMNTIWALGKLYNNAWISALDLKRYASLLDSLKDTDTDSYSSLSASLQLLAAVGLSEECRIPRSQARRLLTSNVKKRKVKKALLNAPAEIIIKKMKDFLTSELKQYNMQDKEYRFIYPANYNLISAITDNPAVIIHTLMAIDFPEIVSDSFWKRLRLREKNLRKQKDLDSPDILINLEINLIQESTFILTLLNSETDLPLSEKINLLINHYTKIENTWNHPSLE